MLSGLGSWNPEDTIVALATPAVPSERAIVRLSGARSHEVLFKLFQPDLSPDFSISSLPVAKRTWVEGVLPLASWPERNLTGAVPAAAHLWPAGRGFTKQESAELHLSGSMPLVEIVIEEAIRAGARLARPGEFSMRAFLAGQIDLSQAEAIVGLAAARTPLELRFAMERMAGGIRHPVEELSSDLLNLLADLEAGLDFVDEDISFVDASALLLRLGAGIAKARNLRRRMVEKDANMVRPMVALAGPPNAGKSTLFNLLTTGEYANAATRASARHAGKPNSFQAIVSDAPGTTRDWLVAPGRLPGGTEVDWVDTAGLGGDSVDELDAKARGITMALLPKVDLVIVCRPAIVQVAEKIDQHDRSWEEAVGLPGEVPALRIVTRADEAEHEPSPDSPAISAFKRSGISEFLSDVESQLQSRGLERLPPLARCQAHFEIAEASLRRAHEHALDGEDTEVIALELRAALDALGEMTGKLFTDDLLDRVFTRFCIGK